MTTDQPAREQKVWRIGRKIPINVYEDDGDTSRPICQCHTVEDAKLIVRAVAALALREEALERAARRIVAGKPFIRGAAYTFPYNEAGVLEILREELL